MSRTQQTDIYRQPRLKEDYMLANVNSGGILGIDTYHVEVEVDFTMSLPFFNIVGLPDGTVRESRDRVRAAIKNSGYEFPNKRVTVNLAPANVKKEGSQYDLPIAVGILSALGQVKRAPLSQILLIGELSLDGRIKPVKGAILLAFLARSLGMKGLILPRENAAEGALVEGIPVFGVEHFSEVVEFLNERLSLSRWQIEPQEALQAQDGHSVDFSDLKGQEHLKRALEIAASGSHNFLMTGPPGTGKTLAASCLPTVLPPLHQEEALETTKIYSVMGLLNNNGCLISQRPFRAPHHTISDAGMIGGGAHPRPGEVSLAHNGVLFLDELSEFKRNVLEGLRQPLEKGQVTIARAATSLSYPAQFMLVAAMNPCPCGNLTHPKNQCTCSLPMLQRYQGKISGPLLDRIDMHVDVPLISYQALSSMEGGEPSQVIRERVAVCRDIQEKRYASLSIHSNAHIPPRLLKTFCEPDTEAKRLLETAVDKMGLSARAYTRILKVARTIADLEGTEKTYAPHIAEAIQYRHVDQQQALPY